MADNYVKVSGTSMGNPVRVELEGGKWIVLTIVGVIMAIYIVDINSNLDKHNKLMQEQIKLEQKRLDLATRAHRLDSIKHADFMQYLKTMKEKQK